MHVMRYCFNLACFLLAFGLCFYWCFKYWEDEDLCVVDYKTFQDAPDVDYPMLSICLNNPFIKSKFSHNNNFMTEKKYVEILKGELESDEFQNIVFDDVTKNLSSFIKADQIRLQNGTLLKGWYPHLLNEMPDVTYSGFVHNDFMRCVGLKPEYRNMKYAMFGFNASIFPNSMRENRNFSTRLHLPYKFLISDNTYKSSWPERKEKKEYLMAFVLNQIDILKRRNKRSDPCIPDGVSYENEVLNTHLGNIGCWPPYQKTKINHTICSSRNDLNAAKLESTVLSNLKKACTTAEIITYTYEEYEIKRNGSDWVWFVIDYPKKFKEIKMVKAVNIQTVIGNSGGYVGLFLGNIVSDSYF